MTRPVGALFILLSLAAPAAAQLNQSVAPATPLVIGETLTIDSKVLSETRRINVYVPPGYAESADARFPVLYMPDGGMAEDFLHVAGLVQVSVGNGTMRPFLLVGTGSPLRPLSGSIGVLQVMDEIRRQTGDRYGRKTPGGKCAGEVLDRAHVRCRNCSYLAQIARVHPAFLPHSPTEKRVGSLGRQTWWRDLPDARHVIPVPRTDRARSPCLPSSLADGKACRLPRSSDMVARST